MASFKQAKLDRCKAHKYILYCRGIRPDHTIEPVILDVYANSEQEALQSAFADIAANEDGYYQYNALMVNDVRMINTYKAPSMYTGA